MAEAVYQDLKRGWLNVARRLQSVARSQGYSVLTIRVVVDGENNPVLWAEPTRALIEPKAVDAAQVLALLTGGDCGGKI